MRKIFITFFPRHFSYGNFYPRMFFFHQTGKEKCVAAAVFINHPIVRGYIHSSLLIQFMFWQILLFFLLLCFFIRCSYQPRTLHVLIFPAKKRTHNNHFTLIYFARFSPRHNSGKEISNFIRFIWHLCLVSVHEVRIWGRRFLPTSHDKTWCIFL